MNLYKLTQDSETGYDTYDSCVVCAESEEDAKRIHPGRFGSFASAEWWKEDESYGSWPTSLDKISVQFLGPASPTLSRGVICASFNSG